jgi:alpha 1,2-mannosyltransferase
MLINTSHCVSTILRLGAIILFLLTCISYLLPRTYNASAAAFTSAAGVQNGNFTEASSTFNASVVDFWQNIASALLEAKPQCNPLQIFEEPIENPDDRFEPLKPYKKHPNRLHGFTDEDETALLRAHYSMRRSAQHLAPKLAFAKGTTGIVSTANSAYMPVFLVSLRMIRRTGCQLPVEVFIDDWSEYDATTCDVVLPSLNARCVVLSNIYNQNTDIKKPDHYQYKMLAILFSTFQNVLFLDSDAFPSYDPTVLFSTAPYTTHGLVTWPDFFAVTVSEHFYHIAAIPAEPPSTRLSTESGQVLLNKDIHRESLLMMVYYNYYGPDYYYPLLCQGSHGAGDKETFVQAAMAVGLPWYQVKTAPSALGRFWNGSYRGTGIAQADPGLDYEYLAPMRSHIHDHNQWEKQDLEHPDPTVEKALNHSRHVPPPPRPVFMHQNMLKLNPAKVLEDKNEIVYEPDGTLHRMWGSKEDMEKMLGYDVERRLWGVIAEEGCRMDQDSETCTKIRAYVREVFGWMDSIERPW